jgi:hypothetical protein
MTLTASKRLCLYGEDTENYILIIIYNIVRSRDSAVGIATAHGLDDSGSEFEPRQGKEFSLLRSVQTDPGAHTASYPMGTGDPFAGGKAAGA